MYVTVSVSVVVHCIVMYFSVTKFSQQLNLHICSFSAQLDLSLSSPSSVLASSFIVAES